MAVLRAPGRTAIALLLAAVVAGLPASATAAEYGPPSRLLMFLPGTASELFPGTVYVDHPFDIYVWIADQGGQLVKAGTSAVVTLTVDPGPDPRPALSCPGGPSVPTNTTDPNAGLAVFAGCTFDRAARVTLTATASNVASTTMPAPTIAPQTGVPLDVLPSVEAPQESITLTLDGTANSYVVLDHGRSATLRVRFAQHGADQPFQLQAGPRTASSWRTVANLVTDADGTASISVRPDVSTWYRVIYQGSPELAAGRSRLFTALVQAVAEQRPVHDAARVIDRGTTVRFTTTIRPVLAGQAPMKVGFQLYHRVGGKWRLVACGPVPWTHQASPGSTSPSGLPAIGTCGPTARASSRATRRSIRTGSSSPSARASRRPSRGSRCASGLRAAVALDSTTAPARRWRS